MILRRGIDDRIKKNTGRVSRQDGNAAIKADLRGAGGWQAHVEHAAGMLADCGVLVAIVPSSANEKFKIPGFGIEWLGVYDDCFAGTSVSVAMMRVTHG